MEKKYYFISGLPRSGSTVLCNILIQNPRFYVTPTSGIMDIIFMARNSWNTLVEFQASPNEAGKLRVLGGILKSYFADRKEPVIFDKCRGWTSLIELAELIVENKVKLIIPVRDIRDILSSFEKLHRKNFANHKSMESSAYFQSQTVKGRSDILMLNDSVLGVAYDRIMDALQRGHGDKMFFIDFDEFTRSPRHIMRDVYEFLEEEYFEHDFDNIEQVTKEDDGVHGIKGLHDIKPKLQPLKSDWREILGDWAEDLSRLNFWKNKA